MKVAFRTDAALQIGTGHVMRCLTLAGYLRKRGAICNFVCREHNGNLIEYISAQGFEVVSLPSMEAAANIPQSLVPYANWLGADITTDANQTWDALQIFAPDWLVLDHYGIDKTWQKILRSRMKKILVIDDLANRNHICDVLIDQNYGRSLEDYKALVPAECDVYTGTQFALLRAEFAEQRRSSLLRRQTPKLCQLLISMGGVDEHNVTQEILSKLTLCDLPNDLVIKVVLGGNAPWAEQVTEFAKTLRYQTEVLLGVSNMAELMEASDLAIGAAGGTTWERCAMGLPSIIAILAENQRLGATQLAMDGVVRTLDTISDLPRVLGSTPEMINSPKMLLKLSTASSGVVDGLGTQRVGRIIQGG